MVAVPDAPGAPDLLWVLMVSSAGHRSWCGDVVVSDLVRAGLPAPSLVRSAKIATIETRDAERIGRLAETDRPQVAAALRGGLAQLLGS